MIDTCNYILDWETGEQKQMINAKKYDILCLDNQTND